MAAWQGYGGLRPHRPPRGHRIANTGLVCFMLCLKHNKQTDYRSLPGGFQFEAAYEVSVCLVSWTLSLAPITYLDRITETYEDLK